MVSFRGRIVPWILVSSLVSFWPASAFAKDFYVDAVNGSPDGDGSAAHPWQSIQEVVDSGLIRTQTWESLPYEEGKALVVINADAPVKAGDTIYLRNGYYGDLFIQALYNEGDIVIAAEPGQEPHLRTIHVQGGSHWVFRNLVVSTGFEEPITASTLVFLENHGFRGPTHDILVDGCRLMTVEDSSSWSLEDWNNLPSNGVRADGDNITIQGCHLLNVNFGITLSGQYSVAKDNVIENFAGDGMRGLGDYERFEHNVVKNCYDVNENHDDGFQSWSTGPDGVGTGEVVGVELLGNVIINYEDPNQPFRGTLQGIGCFGGMYVDWVVENNLVIVDHYHGISLYGAVNCRVINNTVYDPTEEKPGPAWIMIHDHKDGTPSVDTVVRNNIAPAFSGLDAPGVTADHNLTIDDPLVLFVDPVGYDFHLLATAPAVDSGSDDMAPSVDIEGEPRPQGEGVDMGAYEYHEGTIEYPDGGTDASGPDGGSEESDSGSGTQADAGGQSGGTSDSGCGCHADSGGKSSLFVWFVALFLLFRLKQNGFRSKNEKRRQRPWLD